MVRGVSHREVGLIAVGAARVVPEQPKGDTRPEVGHGFAHRMEKDDCLLELASLPFREGIRLDSLDFQLAAELAAKAVAAGGTRACAQFVEELSSGRTGVAFSIQRQFKPFTIFIILDSVLRAPFMQLEGRW